MLLGLASRNDVETWIWWSRIASICLTMLELLFDWLLDEVCQKGKRFSFWQTNDVTQIMDIFIVKDIRPTIVFMRYFFIATPIFYAMKKGRDLPPSTILPAIFTISWFSSQVSDLNQLVACGVNVHKLEWSWLLWLLYLMCASGTVWIRQTWCIDGGLHLTR